MKTGLSKDRNSGKADEQLPKYDSLSPETVQLFAESQGIVPSAVLGRSAWIVLTEDLNYRLRELAHLSTIFMKHSRRRLLTTEDVNKAAEELDQEPLRGHSTSEAPKLYYLKDLKLYARNEGMIDIVSLSLSCFSPVHRDQDHASGLEAALDGCRVIGDEEGVNVGATRTGNSQDLVAELVSLFLKQQRSLHRESFLREVASKAVVLVPATINSTLEALPQLVDKRQKILPFVARFSRVLVEKASRDSETESVIGRTGQFLVDSLIQEPFEDWSESTCRDIGAALAAISRKFSHVKDCSPRALTEKFLKILENSKESPLAYSTALICIQSLGFTAVKASGFDVWRVLSDHYEWNRSVFETTTPFEPGPASGSFASVAYVGFWRSFVEWYLDRMLMCWEKDVNDTETSEDSLDPWYSLDHELLKNLLHLASHVFGFLRLALKEVLGAGAPRYLNKKSMNMDGSGRVGLESLEKLDYSAKVVEAVVDQLPAVLSAKVPTGKRQKDGWGASGAGVKRRKRRLADCFEIPKRSRLEGQGFLFIFHQTDARVLKDRTIRDNEKQSPAKEDKERGRTWQKWMQEKKLNFKASGRRRSAGMRPWLGCLDVPSLIL